MRMPRVPERLRTFVLGSAGLAAAVAAGASWWRFRGRRRTPLPDPNAADVRATAELADRALESMPEARFEDRDLRHRDAAKYD